MGEKQGCRCAGEGDEGGRRRRVTGGDDDLALPAVACGGEVGKGCHRTEKYRVGILGFLGILNFFLIIKMFKLLFFFGSLD